jgi:hypothetical protein
MMIAVITASTASPAASSMSSLRVGGLRSVAANPTAQQVWHRRTPAVIGNVQQLGASHVPEKLPVKMWRAADASRRHGHLAGIGFGVCD